MNYFVVVKYEDTDHVTMFDNLEDAKLYAQDLRDTWESYTQMEVYVAVILGDL